MHLAGIFANHELRLLPPITIVGWKIEQSGRFGVIHVMATSQTWMEGFQTRARAALETALSRLDPEWAVLAELRIDGPSDDIAADYVAIHGAYGIALINASAASQNDPIQRLRDLLERQKFATLFPGNLPIVNLTVRPADAALVARRIDAAFAKAPRLTVRNPDWAAAVQDLLVPIDTEAANPAPAPAPAKVANTPPTRSKSAENRQAPARPKTRPAAAKVETQTSGKPEKAVWGVAAAAKPQSSEQQPPARGDSSPPVATGTAPVDAKPVPAAQGVGRRAATARTENVAPSAQFAEVAVPQPSSLDPTTETRDPVAEDRQRTPEPLRLDRAGDVPRARAVTGEGLVARRDDAIVGPAPSAPTQPWHQWAAAAAVIVLVLGGASWWAFSAKERSAGFPAGSVVTEIASSHSSDSRTPAESVETSPAAPGVAPPAPQAGAIATSPPAPVALDAAPVDTASLGAVAPAETTNLAPQPSRPPVTSTAAATPPFKPAQEGTEASIEPSKTRPSPAEPNIAPPAPAANLVSRASPPVAPTVASARPLSEKAVDSGAVQSPLPRARAASSRSVVANAKPSATPLRSEPASRPLVSETPRSVSRPSNGTYSPGSPSEPSRYDSPPLDVADLPPLETPAKPSQTGALAAPSGGLHGPTSLLPPSPVVQTSAAATTSGAPPTEVCRSYTAMKTLLGQSRPVSGVTCRGPDGQWHIITELPN